MGCSDKCYIRRECPQNPTLIRYLAGKPEILNTDQESLYTSEAFTDVLKDNGIKISMDGKGA